MAGPRPARSARIAFAPCVPQIRHNTARPPPSSAGCGEGLGPVRAPGRAEQANRLPLKNQPSRRQAGGGVSKVRSQSAQALSPPHRRLGLVGNKGSAAAAGAEVQI